MSSTQNPFEITSPRNFTIQLLYNRRNGTTSCNDVEVEKRKWMNPCDIETYESGSVYQHIIARILDALILGLKSYITLAYMATSGGHFSRPWEAFGAS